MQDPCVEIWEGAALFEAPSVGANPDGFVRAAVLRWCDGASGGPSWLWAPTPAPRVAELWTGPGVVVAGVRGALTVSTALADGSSVVTTNIAGPDAAVPSAQDALVAVVDGDVVAIHGARVAARCAELGTSAVLPSSWRAAPLVAELGERTARASVGQLERGAVARAQAPWIVGSALISAWVVTAAVWGVGGRPPMSIRWGVVPVLVWPLWWCWDSLAQAARARQRIRALVPGLEETAVARFGASRPPDYRLWLLKEPDPQIEALSLASDATRATLGALGFTRRGALRAQVDYPSGGSARLQPAFDRLREGKAVAELWVDRSGRTMAWADAVCDEQEVEFVTLLSDATLVTTVCLGAAAAKELAWGYRSAPRAGLFQQVRRGLPGADSWEAHERLVDQVRTSRGASVELFTSLRDAVFLRRLAMRKARAAGTELAARIVVGLFMVTATAALWLQHVGTGDAPAARGFGVIVATGIGVAGFALDRFIRGTGPKVRTLAALRALPVSRERDGPLGRWLE